MGLEQLLDKFNAFSFIVLPTAHLSLCLFFLRTDTIINKYISLQIFISLICKCILTKIYLKYIYIFFNRNILIAPHPENLNQEIIFPGIITAALKVDEISFTEWKSQIRKQFAIVVVCVQRARNILLESYPNESL